MSCRAPSLLAAESSLVLGVGFELVSQFGCDFGFGFVVAGAGLAAAAGRAVAAGAAACGGFVAPPGAWLEDAGR